MNPTKEELKHRLSRAVPVDMLNDPDFNSILKEKARNSAPSEESVSEYQQVEEVKPKKSSRKRGKSRKERLFDAARNPAKLLDPYDRDMVPNLENRTRLHNQEELSSYTQMFPQQWSWNVYALLGLLLFITMILVKRWKLVSSLGISYGLGAELPFLSGFLCIFAGVTQDEFRAKISNFGKKLQILPPPKKPTVVNTVKPEPQAVNVNVESEEEKKKLEEERKENILMMIDESLYYADQARGTTEDEDDEDSVISQEDVESDSEHEEEPKKTIKVKDFPLPPRKTTVKQGVVTNVVKPTIPQCADNPKNIPVIKKSPAMFKPKTEGTIPGVKTSKSSDEAVLVEDASPMQSPKKTNQEASTIIGLEPSPNPKEKVKSSGRTINL